MTARTVTSRTRRPTPTNVSTVSHRRQRKGETPPLLSPPRHMVPQPTQERFLRMRRTPSPPQIPSRQSATDAERGGLGISRTRRRYRERTTQARRTAMDMFPPRETAENRPPAEKRIPSVRRPTMRASHTPHPRWGKTPSTVKKRRRRVKCERSCPTLSFRRWRCLR